MKTPSRELQAAFTLLEIMMVVAIIMLLLAAAVFKMKGSLETARITRAHADLKTIQTALVSYEALAGNLPTTSQGMKALEEKPTSDPKPRNWTKLLSPLPKDPWGHEYLYTNPGKHVAGSYDLYCAGPDGQANTEDDIGNWQEL